MKYKRLFFIVIVFPVFAFGQSTAKKESQIIEFINNNMTYSLLSLPVDKMSELDAIFLNALLEVNGLRATQVYRQISSLYSNSGYASICMAKLTEYNEVLNIKPLPFNSSILPKLPEAKTVSSQKPLITKSLDKTSPSTQSQFVIQFGSFSSEKGSRTMVARLKQSGVSGIIKEIKTPNKKTFYKVWSSETFKSYTDAKQFAERTQLEYFIVQAKD